MRREQTPRTHPAVKTMTAPPSTFRLARTELAFHALAVTLLSALCLHFMVAARAPVGAPQSDARVYVKLALGLGEFAVFGRYDDADHPPAPAMDVAPLYPWFVAQLMKHDAPLRESLVCTITRRGNDAPPCPQAFASLLWAQTTLLVVTLTLLWATAYAWAARPLCAWAAWLLALTAGIVPEYASVFLTEALTLPLGGLFTFALALLIKRHGTVWPAFMAGLALGLLSLTRPSFWYLLLAMTALSVMLVWVPRWRRAGAALLLMCVMGGAVTAPWLLRNHAQFDRLTLSGGDYGGRSLMQRLAYNDMSLAEFGAAFIYWLPEWGDSLARALLPPSSYRRLGWDDQHAFYRQGVARMRADMQAGVVKSEVDTLLRDEVLSHPIRHTRATLALAWRGIFIGKTWGFVAWLCAAAVLWRGWQVRNFDYLLLCAPAWFLCLFQAAVSVSIPRYNLLLLPLLALAMGLQIDRYFGQPSVVLGGGD